MINDSDLDLFRVVDTAEDARDKIVEFHSKYNGSNIEGGQSNF
jgi:predicted Rossmann-fold nucleotide-binding protein